jgi:DNA-directed RNA polymerase beta subunit
VLKVPYLLKIQKESYHQFLQADTPPEQRIDQGLQAAFKTVFPIESYNGNAALEFVGYPRHSTVRCQGMPAARADLRGTLAPCCVSWYSRKTRPAAPDGA